jgi:hypothetical protein
LNKKKSESDIQESHPQIIEIEDQEIQEKMPPRDDIIYFKMVDVDENSKLEEKKQ